MSNRLKEIFRATFSLDLRSLGLCRILTGLLIVGDLLVRLTEFRIHYSHIGMFPRAAAMQFYSNDFPGIYLLSDSNTVACLLFGAHGLTGLAVCLGYRTRLFTVLAWYFQHSLMQRNFMVNNGGDAVLVCLLFWAMFVPWGARFSVDAAWSKRLDNPNPEASGADGQTDLEFSAGSFCLINQALLIYLVSVYHKMEPTWFSGQALYYALQSDLYSRPTREYLLPYTELLKAFTYATLVGESLGPLGLVCPWWRLRTLVCIAFIFMHSCFGFFLRIGSFALIPGLNAIALLPSGLWNHFRVLERRLDQFFAWFAGLRLCLRLQPALAKPRFVLDFGSSWLLYALALFCWVQGVGTTWEVSRTKSQNPLVIPQLRWIAPWTGLTQRWHVFVNLPQITDGWFLVEGTTESGDKVDIFQGRDPFRWDKPVEVSELHGLFRWPTPMICLMSQPELQPWFIKALVREWNDGHSSEKQVVSVRFYFCSEPSLKDYLDSPPQTKLLNEWKP